MMHARIPEFESPSFAKRVKGMLSVDLYRLFHTPMLYIFLAISALIPAMVLSMTGTAGQHGGGVLYTNTWQIVAAESPLYVFSDISEYANMNMVFIFGGIMVAVFVGNDYRSGYVKQLFTTHSKKLDYMLSKSLIGALSMASMCIAYLIGSVVAGFLIGASFQVDVASLVIAIASKMVMSFGWAALFTFLSVLFRRYFGIPIAACFFFGTGILVIGAAAIVGNSPVLNAFLYGSSVFACLSSNLVTLLVCAVVSAAWFAAYNALGALALSKTDIY